MKITISNEIRIQDAIPELMNAIRKELTFANPEYIKKQRMGLWTGKTDPEVRLYYTDGDNVIIPCGAGALLQPYISQQTEITSDLADNGLLEYQGIIPLYDYQKAAVEAMAAAGNGILQSPCGSGKTQCGIALAALLKCKTLWLTHTQDLLNQSYARAAQYYPEEILGKITAGEIQIGSHITFATVQTISKTDLLKYKYTWDVIIVDECHRCAGSPAAVHMFYKVMSNLAARNKFGLSATVHRSDGLIKSTFAIIGPVQYQVPDAAVAEKTMQVTIKRRNTETKLNRYCLDTDGTLVYAKLLSFLTECADRNKMIVNDLVNNAEHYNLILSDRLEHLHTLMELLPDRYRTSAVMIDGHMSSKKAKTERVQALEDLRSGKKHFLFASYSLAKEGLDVPRMDRVYLTTPKKDYAVVTQSIGRITRVFDGKKSAICFDYVDDIAFCENQYKKRKTSYRKARCVICE